MAPLAPPLPTPMRMEEVISSVVDLQLTKFIQFKNLFNNMFRLLLYMYGCAPGGRVCNIDY